MLQVMFKNYSPKQTLYIEPTTKIQKMRINSAIPLELWDCPGNVPLPTLPLNDFSTILFVIDIQDNFNYSIPRLVDVITTVYHVNPEINIEVFVHKADVLADDYRIDTNRHVQQRIIDDLTDASLDVESLQLQFHITTIYDHSIHESFSLVVQKLIDPLPYLEELLNVFCANSRLSKAFLFDTNSRIYVATDASPVDAATHNVCCDYVQMMSQFAPLYAHVFSHSITRSILS
ncbi:Gtr1/RagA G protein [Hysterangium stoloniferum]|nr:Gtr1/RagA G protein [Hysterangium stoloniferum]